MESLLKKWGGEEVIIRSDRPTGAWIIVAVHSTRLGPSAGGTRMKAYPGFRAALADALRLATGMSYKFAVANIPFGGAKAVIALPKEFDPAARAGLLRRYGELIHQLGGLYHTGSDVGTTSEDMDVIAETGAPYVFSRTPAKGGAGGSGRATALGVFSGMQAVCEHLFGDPSLAGKRVLVLGVGSVGGPLVHLLRDAKADVFFSDVDPTAIRHFRDELGIPFVPPERVFDTPCDLLSPCALGGILNKQTIPNLRCLAVAGGANNQLAEKTGANRLRRKKILYAPDYVINIGGAMAIIGMETLGWPQARADNEVKSVRATLLQIFEAAKMEGITPEAAARRIAEARLSDKRE